MAQVKYILDLKFNSNEVDIDNGKFFWEKDTTRPTDWEPSSEEYEVDAQDDLSDIAENILKYASEDLEEFDAILIDSEIYDFDKISILVDIPENEVENLKESLESLEHSEYCSADEDGWFSPKVTGEVDEITVERLEIGK